MLTVLDDDLSSFRVSTPARLATLDNRYVAIAIEVMMLLDDHFVRLGSAHSEGNCRKGGKRHCDLSHGVLLGFQPCEKRFHGKLGSDYFPERIFISF
jgi:hypothetical protein